MILLRGRTSTCWSKPTVKINELLAQNKGLNCWSTFDLDVHPLSTSTHGRMCLVGNAVHANSPHVGMGASMGIKGSAVVTELLVEAQSRIRLPGEGSMTAVTVLEATFRTFNIHRREQTHWLVQNSRAYGDIFQWRYPPSGKYAEKCREELEWRAQQIRNMGCRRDDGRMW